MKLQFKIWHLLLFTLAVAFLVFTTYSPERFPIPNVEAAATVNSQGWRLIETIGDTEGPYELVSEMDIGRDASLRKTKIRYQFEDVTQRYVVPPSLDTDYLKLVAFENPKRSSLVLVYAKDPQ